MQAILLSGAAALVLLAAPAAAQNNTSKSVDPHQLTLQSKKSPLKLDNAWREVIRNALVEQHRQQKTPKDFKPQVGAVLPKGIKIDVMPQALGRQLPIMKEYGYAKTEQREPTQETARARRRSASILFDKQISDLHTALGAFGGIETLPGDESDIPVRTQSVTTAPRTNLLNRVSTRMVPARTDHHDARQAQSPAQP